LAAAWPKLGAPVRPAPCLTARPLPPVCVVDRVGDPVPPGVPNEVAISNPHHRALALPDDRPGDAKLCRALHQDCVARITGQLGLRCVMAGGRLIDPDTSVTGRIDVTRRKDVR
jgi:hypothetical protein